MLTCALLRCCCGRLVRQHAGFPASLAVRYSDGRLGDDPDRSAGEPQEWAVDRHTEESPTDAYGVVNFQGGSHSYRAKVRGWSWGSELRGAVPANTVTRQSCTAGLPGSMGISTMRT